MIILCIIISHTNSFSQVKIPLKLKPVIKLNKIPDGLKLPPKDSLRKAIDPAAVSVSFSLNRRIDDFKAMITIAGIVTNIGKDNYNSNPGQQVILLYEDMGGTPKLVATKAFQNLTKGKSVKIGFTREWNKSSPAEGEFPPNYTLVISYDPDIYLDNNPDNNDINSKNNRLVKSSAEVNAMEW